MNDTNEMLDDAWVRTSVFCQKHKQQETTVRKRIHDGAWERGVIYACSEGGTGYIHEARALAWIAERRKPEE
jgi:hypothetical protein